MRHLKKIAPSRPGMGFKLPEGNLYYPLVANYYPHHDDFLGTVIDSDEWATDTTLASDGAGAVTFAQSFVTLVSGTATGSTSISRFRSAMTSDANLYNMPFRATFVARTSHSAGSGVAPTGGLDLYFGIRSTDETHLAQFHLDLTTAGSSSCASPVVNMEIRTGSTATNNIASAAANIWNTAASVLRSATGFTALVIEATHKGVWFGYKDDQNDLGPARELFFSKNPLPRHDKNYFLDMRLVANGTAGYTMTAPVNVNIDSVTVEQLAPIASPWFGGMETDVGATQSVILTQAVPTGSAGLVTTGAGIFLGMSITTTATAALDSYIAAYDMSAGSTAAFDHSFNPSAGAKLLWLEQVRAAGSVPSSLSHNGPASFPATGIPFFRGLVVGGVNAVGGASGTSALNALVVFRGQR